MLNLKLLDTESGCRLTVNTYYVVLFFLFFFLSVSIFEVTEFLSYGNAVIDHWFFLAGGK